MLVVGLHVGQEAISAIATSETGDVAFSCREPLAASREGELSAGWMEYDAEALWNKAAATLGHLAAELRSSGRDVDSVRSLSVSSIPGTVVAVDASGRAVRPVISRDDSRAQDEASRTNIAGGKLIQKTGYRFQPSSALSKILWLKKHDARTYHGAQKFLSAGGFITGKLTGNFSVTDTTSALEAGYDPVDAHWPRFLTRDLDIDQKLLPAVFAPGATVGKITAQAQQATGLPARLEVVAGATQEVTALISSGAALCGEWNSALGSRLVVRGILHERLRDREDRFYCHLHPEGCWLPVGESSSGGLALEERFSGERFEELDRQVPERTPSSLIVYPLAGRGERLPFVKTDAEGYIIGKPRDKAELYAAFLEGVGMVERWIYEILADLGVEVTGSIYTSGGGARSDEWMKLRANMLGRPTVRSRVREPAFGAAVLAATSTLHRGSLSRATKAMVRMDNQWEPSPEAVELYTAKYRKFREACRAIGYE